MTYNVIAPVASHHRCTVIRQAAVHGTVYMLRTSAKALVVDKETNEFRGVITDEFRFKARALVVSPEYLVNVASAPPTMYVSRDLSSRTSSSSSSSNNNNNKFGAKF
jgi:hypothetical protein